MIYFYDGEEDAFLTALAVSFHDENAVLTSTNQQLLLGQETVFVRTDHVLARKIEKRLLSFDKSCIEDLDLLLRNGGADKDTTAFNYFRLLAKEKRPVRNMLTEGAALSASEYFHRLARELDHMRGFVRFMESANGALYAPVSPDNDIVDLLAPHFRARFKNYPFVLHDVKRKKACVYDGKSVFLAPLDCAEIVLSADENVWQDLWRDYYESVNIPERERLKQMRGYLPVRYRKFMPEFSQKKN